MTSLVTFPSELLLNIAQSLDGLGDLAAFALTCRSTFSIANHELYQRASSIHDYILCWGSDLGRLETVRRILAAGADPNTVWVSRWGHPLWKNPQRSASASEPLLKKYYARTQRWILRSSRDEGLVASHAGDFYLRISHGADDLSSEKVAEDSPKTTQDLWAMEMFEDNAGESSSDGIAGNQHPVPFKPSRWIEDDPAFGPLCLDRHMPSPSEDEAHELNHENDIFYWSPLHLAARHGHTEIVQLLIDSGANLDEKAKGVCRCKHTSLDSAERTLEWPGYQRLEAEKVKLLESHVRVSALHVALCHGHEGLALDLLRRGASRTFDKPRWKSHVMHTAAAFGCLNVVKYLVSNGRAAEIDVQDSQGLTPLYYAYSTRQTETVSWLIENKADVDADLGDTLTLLHLACLDGAFALASRLIDAGADFHRRWSNWITPHLAELRPLEICCLMRPEKSARAYAPGDTSLHHHRFERRRIGLMKKLLDSGVSVTPMPGAPCCRGAHVSAVTLAAANHSIDMLELLARSGADMAQEGAAIHAAIYPTFMEWKKSPSPSPLETLRWLVAHGVPVEGESRVMVDALSIVCELESDCPWKADVLEWLVERGVRSDIDIDVDAKWPPRLHPMDPDADEDLTHYQRTTNPFWEALSRMDFVSCEILLCSKPRPSLVQVLRHLAKNSTSRGCSWPPGRIYGEKDKKDRLESEKRVEFLLAMDEEKTIRNNPDTLSILLDADILPPSALLLECVLPANAARYSTREDKELIQPFMDLRDRDPTKPQSYWDLAYRLVRAIIHHNWNAARFILEHCDDISWAQGKGMEELAHILSALDLSPSPSAIGLELYQVLILRWRERHARKKTDIRTSLFHESCASPIGPGPFLIGGEIDVNAVDGEKNTALHMLFKFVRNAEMFHFSGANYDTPVHLLQLLRAGADPRAVNRSKVRVLDHFKDLREGKIGRQGPLKDLKVMNYNNDIFSKQLTITLQYLGNEEEFVFR